MDKQIKEKIIKDIIRTKFELDKGLDFYSEGFESFEDLIKRVERVAFVLKAILQTIDREEENRNDGAEDFLKAINNLLNDE